VTPGTHGIVQPWIPPTTGIPAGVLDELEAHLFRKLINVLHRLEKTLPESTNFSPGESDMGEDEDPLELPPLERDELNRWFESNLSREIPGFCRSVGGTIAH
jgi:hypothetical protein